MKKTLQVLCALLFSAGAALAQTCSLENPQTQADIDNFRALNPGCKVIAGSINIISSTITNLDSLLDITNIEGSLLINHNPALVSIAGLSSLEQIDGEINIEDNDRLPTLAGLEHFSRPGFNVRVVRNEVLTTISALSGLTSIPGFLSVGENPSLTSLTGLENLTNISGAVSIAGNTILPDLQGIKNLRTVGSFFYLGFNNALTNLSGLDNLQSIGERLEIAGNNSIINLSGIGQLQKVAAIIIRQNPVLSDCAILPVCRYIGNSSLVIYENAPGCASTQDAALKQGCGLNSDKYLRINAGGAAFTSASGKVFSTDQYYQGVDRVHAVSGEITGTNDDELYRNERSATSFNYAIPISEGKYMVRLHFAEIWFGAPGGRPGGTGLRQFNINVEGMRRFTNYDVYARAGGAMRAHIEQLPVSVEDGFLNLDFTSGAANLPTLAAIEIIPFSAIPDGSTIAVTASADAFIRSNLYADQNFGSDSILSVKPGGKPDELRKSYLRFNIPGISNVKSAKLRVYGQNHQGNIGVVINAVAVQDDSWNENTITWNNAPAEGAAMKANVQVNGSARYWEIDVSSFVSDQASGDKVVSLALIGISPRGYLINFHSKENPSGFVPQLIITTDGTVNSGARTGIQENTYTEAASVAPSTIYPNPVQNHFTVELSPAHTGRIAMQLITPGGQHIELPESNAPESTAKREVNLPSEKLPAGLYILKIQSDTSAENVKILLER